MPLPTDTIALPIVKGLDVNTDARLLQAPSLLEAENTTFSGGGAKKRRGHTPLTVRTEAGVNTNHDDIDYWVDDDWHYGQGQDQGRRTVDDFEDREFVVINASVGRLQGVATRDNETVVWDGFRLLSYLPSQSEAQAPFLAEVSGSACMPSLNAGPIAKFTEQQKRAEFADNGLIKVCAWISDSTARYAVYDSVTSAMLSEGEFDEADPSAIRLFSLGTFMHAVVHDADVDRVAIHSVSAYTPNDWTVRSLGDATHFDVWKQSDERAIIARADGTSLHIMWVQETGAGAPDYDALTVNPTLTTGTKSLVSVSYNPEGFGQMVGLSWYDDTNNKVGFVTIDSIGTLSGEAFVAAADVKRLTMSVKLTAIGASDVFDVFWDDGDNLYMARFSAYDFIPVDVRTRYRLCLESRAWRVGDRTFVWASQFSDLQSTYFLLDEQLLPVGKMNFGVADVGDFDPDLRGINFKAGEGYDSTTPRFQHALSYKLRVVPSGVDQATGGIYTEPSPQAVVVDFLPRMRWAQAGRTLYIAGAQLWAYDGQELVEAGFHTGPEPSLDEVAGGSLTSEGSYSYRIDLCHKNAQNEEVRSLSILSSTIELDPGNQTIQITIPTVVTRREDSYFLIYRNAMEDGTPLANWWLLNSRDPTDASFLLNDLSVATVTYTDDGTVDDTEIQTREFHPASDTYVQPISAPACEIIAAGRDRLWVAGGELPPGKVAPSRLFEPGDTPSFNSYLEFQVDRSNEPVTAIGFMGEVGAIFRSNSSYLIDSDGPDNNGSGFWNPARLALTDTGAVSQDSVLRVSLGLLFQSPAGFRLLTPGGQLAPVGTGGGQLSVGLPVDPVAQEMTVVGSMVVEKEHEARFYGTEFTMVYNYVYDTWARWSTYGIGVAKNTNGLALIAREDGKLFIETEGHYTDGDVTYTHRIRTSWLHGGNLGDFQRVRRVGGLGRYSDRDNPSHTLRLEFYYDEREFWEERIEWTLPDSTTNQDTWGAGDYGDGVLGDTTAVANNMMDSTWEWVRRPSRQKCSVVSIALEDVNTDGPGFELTAFTLELARKQGLNRVPERTGTGSYR